MLVTADLAPRDGAAGRLKPGGRSLALVVTDVTTGAARKIHYSTEWLNHLQASPADPHRLLFCHEGDWHRVDRVWTIRTDGTGLRLLHRRTMLYEIAGLPEPTAKQAGAVEQTAAKKGGVSIPRSAGGADPARPRQQGSGHRSPDPVDESLREEERTRAGFLSKASLRILRDPVDARCANGPQGPSRADPEGSRC